MLPSSVGSPAGGWSTMRFLRRVLAGLVTVAIAALTGAGLSYSDTLRDRHLVVPESLAEPDHAEIPVSAEDVSIAGPLGDLPGWWIPGESATWALLVPGRGADLRQVLPILPTLSEAGLPVLIVSYRNQPGAPETEGRLALYGQTEWEDLEAAVRHTRREGARSALLVGYGMGGSVAMGFLARSPLAETVRGVIMDAPVVDVGATVDWEMDRRGVPAVVTDIAKAISSARFGISWSATNYLARADELEVPVLVLHGVEDSSTPIEISRAFAQANPQEITVVAVPQAGHLESWTVDPALYDARVRDFVSRVTD